MNCKVTVHEGFG